MAKVLFVCTGNTCRSPMAAAILKHLNNHFEVKSAGIFALSGANTSFHTKEVLTEQGMDIDHTSTLLTEEQVDWADYIFTMTKSQKEHILEYFKKAADKVFTLKEFAGDEGDVADPFGGSKQIYRETFNELKRLIEKAEKKLLDQADIGKK